jgi:hypothetical protein
MESTGWRSSPYYWLALIPLLKSISLLMLMPLLIPALRGVLSINPFQSRGEGPAGRETL